jgi:antitoxin ParD1/3/4
MTDEPRQRNPEVNLAEAIRRRFAPVGGADDLVPHPPVMVGEPPWRAFDQTLAEVRSKFTDMSPEALEALIVEAVTAVRAARFRAAATGQAEAQEPDHMRHEDFRIGDVFWCGGRQWRCTDIGTRVITAIRLDLAHVESTAPEQRRTLNRAEAEAEGWFNGPPYAVNEVVFDEYDIEGCTREPEADGEANAASGADAPEPSEDDRFSPETLARLKAQAARLREQARAGGLRFDAYLPPRLADWLLAHVEQGTFRDPSEAVFVILGEHEELEPHADLRRELLNRSLAQAMEGPFITSDELRGRLDEKLRAPLPVAAVWRKDS